MQPIHRSKASKKTVNNEIQQLIDQGMLIPLRSSCKSLFLIVKKKDGSSKVVIDYPQLKNITNKDFHPLPRIEDAL